MPPPSLHVSALALAAGGEGCGPCLMVTVYSQGTYSSELKTLRRYVFNPGEGTQRVGREYYHVKFDKLAAVFVTSGRARAISGLTGLILSLSGSGAGELALWGPPGTAEYLRATRHFLQRRWPQVRVGNVGEGEPTLVSLGSSSDRRQAPAAASAGQAGKTSMAESAAPLSPQVVFDDKYLRVTAVAAVAAAATAAKPLPGGGHGLHGLHGLAGRRKCSVTYICEVKGNAASGGHGGHGGHGGDDSVVDCFWVVDCPTVEAIGQLPLPGDGCGGGCDGAGDYGGDDDGARPTLRWPNQVFHLTLPEVVARPEYRTWLGSFLGSAWEAEEAEEDGGGEDD